MVPFGSRYSPVNADSITFRHEPLIEGEVPDDLPPLGLPGGLATTRVLGSSPKMRSICPIRRGTIPLPPELMEIEIDIKPGSDRNSINPMSKGVIPVAILGSDEFDVRARRFEPANPIEC